MALGVLITGGSRGIGAAMVKRLTDDGHRVVFTYCKEREKAEKLAAETGATPICANAEDESEVLKSTEKAKEILGQIDVLVNNAAISDFQLFTDISTADWNRFLSVNLTAPFLYARECARGMIGRHFGRIVNISSVWGITGASCEVHYSTTKAGLIGLTRALAKELGPSGITVNCVAPGVIDTEMNAMLDEDTRAELIAQTPLCRFGTPAEIAATVAFLIGDGGEFITGQIISPNGGFLI